TTFYDSLEVDGVTIADKHRGALPFRVAEMYEAMVNYAAAGDVNRFVAAGGLMAHFVGDACQPLHVSALHHGRTGTREKSDVNSTCETTLGAGRPVEGVDGVNRARGHRKRPTTMVTGGAAAAPRVVTLMKDTLGLIPPIEVIDAFNAETGRDRI